jgi:uncharacterized Ntn-hydrolase superfamily protein
VRRPARLLAALALLAPAPASATWSIVAVDPVTREVGIAGASCIPLAQMIAGLAPGRGAIAAQAMANFAGRDRGSELLAGGASPRQAIAALATPAFDSVAGIDTTRLRQYGVAALGFESEPVAFTGSWTIAWQGSAQGSGVTVQGNLLAGPAVVADALAAFVAEDAGAAATLADRLLRALEAGAAAGGDARCLPEQAALSAFLFVAQPGDLPESPSLRLVFPDPPPPPRGLLGLLAGEVVQAWRRRSGEPTELLAGEPERNPVRGLRRSYETWRRSLSGTSDGP